eukprot:766707-Amorphochlora_amoeboformis.AAC.1
MLTVLSDEYMDILGRKREEKKIEAERKRKKLAIDQTSKKKNGLSKPARKYTHQKLNSVEEIVSLFETVLSTKGLGDNAHMQPSLSRSTRTTHAMLITSSNNDGVSISILGSMFLLAGGHSWKNSYAEAHGPLTTFLSSRPAHFIVSENNHVSLSNPSARGEGGERMSGPFGAREKAFELPVKRNDRPRRGRKIYQYGNYERYGLGILRDKFEKPGLSVGNNTVISSATTDTETRRRYGRMQGCRFLSESGFGRRDVLILVATR